MTSHTVKCQQQWNPTVQQIFGQLDTHAVRTHAVLLLTLTLIPTLTLDLWTLKLYSFTIPSLNTHVQLPAQLKALSYLTTMCHAVSENPGRHNQYAQPRVGTLWSHQPEQSTTVPVAL